MTPGAVAARLALLGAAWAASALARLLPAHRPIAGALWASLALDLLRLALREHGAPIEVLRALYLAHPAVSVWLTAVVLWRPTGADKAAERSPPMSSLIYTHVLALWLGCSLGVALAENPSREAFARVAATVGGATLAFELGLVTYSFRRLRVPTFTEFVVLMLIAGDLANVLGAWLYEDVWGAWEFNRWQLAMVFGAVWYAQSRRRAWVMTFAPKAARGSSRSARPSRCWRSW